MENEAPPREAVITRLVYGEDVLPGMRIKQRYHAPQDADAPPANPFEVLLGQARCATVDEWVVIAEVRRYGDVMSMIAVREDGTQVPLTCHAGELLTVPVEQP